jgi:hypothetical protein
MDWWANKETVYDDFLSDNIIKRLMSIPAIKEWFIKYINTDPLYRPGPDVILGYDIVKKLSFTQISYLSSLFETIKDFPVYKANQIPIFNQSQKSKIKTDMIKISVSAIKAGMVIALPYKRYLQSEIMTDNGRVITNTNYDDLFVFGVKSIKHHWEKEYQFIIESYTCYEEFCYGTNERKIIINEGNDHIITLGLDKDKDKVYMRDTLYDYSTCSDQSGPSTTYTSFDVFFVLSPEKYI